MTLVKLCHLGKKSYDAKCKRIFGPHAAYVRPGRAAAHGTVCGACLNDVCMRSMGLVVFFS